MPDDNLLVEIGKSLKNHPDLKNYSFSFFEYFGDKIVINGKVRSFYHKQLVQVVVCQIVRRKNLKFSIVNDVVVL